MPEQDALFVDLPAEDAPEPSRLADMHRSFGVAEGKRCGDCRHFQRFKQGTRWQKCDLTRQTGGPGTDWRVKWVACGKWETESMRP
jgi:hypothetical protein